jgi:hypothetical protein
MGGSTLGLTCFYVWSEYLYIGGSLESIRVFFCDGPIKEAHCLAPKNKEKFELGMHPLPKPIDMNYIYLMNWGPILWR